MVGERDGVESNRANGQVRGLHTLELPSFGASEKNERKKKAAGATRGGKYLSVRYLPLPDTRQAYAPTDSFQYSDYTDFIFRYYMLYRSTSTKLNRSLGTTKVHYSEQCLASRLQAKLDRPYPVLIKAHAALNFPSPQ